MTADFGWQRLRQSRGRTNKRTGRASQFNHQPVLWNLSSQDSNLIRRRMAHP
jgi:hypothetical protein